MREPPVAKPADAAADADRQTVDISTVSIPHAPPFQIDLNSGLFAMASAPSALLRNFSV